MQLRPITTMMKPSKYLLDVTIIAALLTWIRNLRTFFLKFRHLCPSVML